MFKAATVTSDNVYSRSSGRDLALALQMKLGQSPNACWLFCAPKEGLLELLEGVNEAVGTRNIVGCTTDGEITGDGYSAGSAILGGIASNQIDFTIAYTENLSRNCEMAGSRLAAKLAPTVQYVQLFSDGITGNGCGILQGILSVLGEDLGLTKDYLAAVESLYDWTLSAVLPDGSLPRIGDSGRVDIRQMVRAGVLLNFIGVLVITAVFLLVSSHVLGIDPTSVPSWAR